MVRLILNLCAKAQFKNGLFIWDLHKNKIGNPNNVLGCLYKTYVLWMDKLILSSDGQPIWGPHSCPSKKDMRPTFQC